MDTSRISFFLPNYHSFVQIDLRGTCYTFPNAFRGNPPHFPQESQPSNALCVKTLKSTHGYGLGVVEVVPQKHQHVGHEGGHVVGEGVDARAQPQHPGMALPHVRRVQGQRGAAAPPPPLLLGALRPEGGLHGTCALLQSLRRGVAAGAASG